MVENNLFTEVLVNPGSSSTGEIYKTKFKVTVSHMDGWINRLGELIPNESHHHVEKALEFVKGIDEESISHGLQPVAMTNFIEANKNKGYDAGEYLIIVYGFIAIESFNVIYAKNTKLTSLQKKAISCIQEEGILKKIDKKSIEERKKHNEYVASLREQEIQRIRNSQKNK